MLIDDHSFAKALGARRAHIIRGKDLAHAGARQAAVLRHVDESEREGRQHEVMEDVEHARPCVGIRISDVVHAGDRGDRDERSEHHQQHQPQPEHWNRIP